MQEVCNVDASGRPFHNLDDANGTRFELESDDADQIDGANAQYVPDSSADAHTGAPPLDTGDDAKAIFNLVDCNAEPTGNADIPGAPHCG